MTTPQAPIGSGFGPATTAFDVIDGIDLTGKVAIVTGGHAGLGLETTQALVAAGARVLIGARDPARAAAAVEHLTGVTIGTLDLLDPVSIDEFANRFLATGQQLDILINNAGTMANPLTRDARGYEVQFATNHLGHFQLTARLWPALVRARGARVVALSSRGHRRSAVHIGDPNFELRPYERWTAYGQSKTANILFALALDRMGEPHGVRAFSVHPGGIITELIRHMSVEEVAGSGALDSEGMPVIDPSRGMKTPEQGAATSVWCAVSPQLDGLGGVYCENCDIAPMADPDAASGPGVKAYAVDPDMARRLWALSDKLTGVSFQAD